MTILLILAKACLYSKAVFSAGNNMASTTNHDFTSADNQHDFFAKTRSLLLARRSHRTTSTGSSWYPGASSPQPGISVRRSRAHGARARWRGRSRGRPIPDEFRGGFRLARLLVLMVNYSLETREVAPRYPFFRIFASARTLLAAHSFLRLVTCDVVTAMWCSKLAWSSSLLCKAFRTVELPESSLHEPPSLQHHFRACSACIPMTSFGLDLDSPLLPNVDAYINPTKEEDVHRSALNAVVSPAGPLATRRKQRPSLVLFRLCFEPAAGE